METLFNENAKQEILERIDKLSAKSPGRWGKMDVAQMLAHCSNIMDVAIDDKRVARSFMGRFIGPLAKGLLYNDKPIPKNSPTIKNFIILDQRDFEIEKIRLISLVNRFHEKGEEGLSMHKHPFFGSLTNEQWGRAAYKEISYHLNQFGV